MKPRTPVLLLSLALATTLLPAQQPATPPAEQPAPPPATAPAPPPAKVVRVSGGVMAKQLIKRVDPVFPIEARAEGLTGGGVVLAVLVGEDGKVEQLKVMSGPPAFSTAAAEAVRKWRYKPYLLNGQPTKVLTTVTLVF